MVCKYERPEDAEAACLRTLLLQAHLNGSEGASMRRGDASMRIVLIPWFRSATNVIEC